MFSIIKKGWTRIARFLAITNSYILLTIVFFLVITPISILYRIFGKPAFYIPGRETFWIKRSVDSSFEKPF